MSKEEDRHKVPAVVSGYARDKERPVSWLQLGKDGWGQGFGGLFLPDPYMEKFERELCRLFRVSSVRDLKGKKCFALYSFGQWNDTIRGLEVDGVVFTIDGFRKRNFPDKEAKSPLEESIESLDSHTARARETVREYPGKLKALKESYVEWQDNTQF